MKQNQSSFFWCLFAVLVVTISFNARADQAKKIEDNSFLIEEAYNQEAGVVQYIQTFQYAKKTKEWLYTFTHEMPFPNQTHQLSYTVPLHASVAMNLTLGLGMSP